MPVYLVCYTIDDESTGGKTEGKSAEMIEYKVHLRSKRPKSILTHSTTVDNDEKTLISIWKELGINPDNETAKSRKVLRIMRGDTIIWPKQAGGEG
jgi:hypothetical protein